MNKTNLALFNRIKKDSLIRTADSAETLGDYLNRYYGVRPENVESLFKAVQTASEKLKLARKAKTLEMVN